MDVSVRFFWALLTFRWSSFQQYLDSERNKRIDASGIHRDYAYYDLWFVVCWHAVMVALIVFGIWGVVG